MNEWKEIAPDEVPWKPAYMLASAPLSQLAPNREQKTNWSLSGVETTCKSKD